MQIDPRLNDVDDCLYRVAIRVLILQDSKVLLVKEAADNWWAFPGGGVDHGESIEATLHREVEEELGVPAKEVVSDFQIAYYNIGAIVNGVPRMNLYFKASVPEASLKQTDHVAEWAWFTKDEFTKVDLNSSYDKAELASVIWGDEDKEGAQTKAVTINKPAKDVFAFTIDPKNTPKWIDAIATEETNEWPPKIGTVYRNQITGGEWREYTMTKFEQDKTFTLSRQDGFHIRYTFVPLDGRTTKLEFYLWMDDGELKSRFTTATLEKLKQLVEATS